jgi:hypothetical protein
MSGNLPSFEIANLRHPTQGGRCIQVSFPFSDGAVAYQGDFVLEILDAKLDFIQSVYVDNSANADAFTLLIPGIGTKGYNLVVPPNTQGMYPIVCPSGPMYYQAFSDGGVDVDCTFFNIPMPYYQAASIAQVAPPVTVITGNDNNFSGACTGADEIVVPANANRKRVVIANAPENNTSIWIRSGVAATENNNSQEVLPGQQYDTGSGPISLSDIHVIGANGVTYFANEIA